MIKKIRIILNIFIITFSLLVFSIVSIYVASFFLGPPAISNEQNTLFFDQHGEIIREEKGAENRVWVKLDQISPYVIDSMIAIEDKNFYEHNGFDFKGIARAILVNIKTKSLKEGASTITQQYARNLFLTHEKKWKRKIKEAFYTVRLEMYYSKDEILEGYLNMIYFGHGAYGIEAASNYFFDKNARDLTLSEATMLVAVPKGPTYYSPLNDLNNAKGRQHTILKKLLQLEKISEDQFNHAINEKLSYKRVAKRIDQKPGPYFFDAALREAQNLLKIDQESIKSGGYLIYTTFNQEKQLELESAIEQTIDHDSELQVAAITMEPSTGAILGLVGGVDYLKSPFNRAISAKRMPGSTFKPFLFYAALENNFTAITTLMSQPTSFILENDEIYEPRNFNGYYAHEPITMAQAIALSDNVYAVKTNLYLGTEILKNTAKKFGIESDLPAVPSLALGTASVSLKEMVTAYATLANGGYEIKGYTIHKIVDKYGNVVYEHKSQRKNKILDSKKAFILTHLLTGMFDENLNGYMSVTGASVSDQLTRPYAGKSGTTKYDSWMIGYSPSLVTGIWTGYDDNRSMDRIKERSYAKDIWAEFMESAHNNLNIEQFPIPKGVIGLPIDPKTGKISTPYCPTSRIMYFVKGTEPKTHCTIHFPHKKNNDVPDDDRNGKGFFRKLFELFT